MSDDWSILLEKNKIFTNKIHTQAAIFASKENVGFGFPSMSTSVT